jgi:lipopolysaccharide/colanic/teichoic acid biosynthesis glycosyltransferase
VNSFVKLNYHQDLQYPVENVPAATKETPFLSSPCTLLEVEDRKGSEWSLESVEERKRRAFCHCRSRRIPKWKRAFDLVVSASLLLILSPLLIAIAAFIRLTSGGPVLFKQVRLGEMGKEFIIYKFRTLHNCPNATHNHRQYVNSLSSADSAIVKPDLTDRMIPGGNFLRKSSLDELPQLMNILKGEMSLVGPRPDVLHWEDYQPYQLRRFEVLPGVTGLWQVNGKNRLTHSQMIEMDIEYVTHRSFLLDLRIALKTVRVLLFREND